MQSLRLFKGLLWKLHKAHPIPQRCCSKPGVAGAHHRGPVPKFRRCCSECSYCSPDHLSCVLQEWEYWKGEMKPQKGTGRWMEAGAASCECPHVGRAATSCPPQGPWLWGVPGKADINFSPPKPLSQWPYIADGVCLLSIPTRSCSKRSSLQVVWTLAPSRSGVKPITLSRLGQQGQQLLVAPSLASKRRWQSVGARCLLPKGAVPCAPPDRGIIPA